MFERLKAMGTDTKGDIKPGAICRDQVERQGWIVGLSGLLLRLFSFVFLN